MSFADNAILLFYNFSCLLSRKFYTYIKELSNLIRNIQKGGPPMLNGEKQYVKGYKKLLCYIVSFILVISVLFLNQIGSWYSTMKIHYVYVP